MPLGTGEQLHTKWGFRELIEEELVDYLRVDICHTAGITEGKKIAAMGEVHYQELACHFTASPVSTAAMLHLNLSVPNCAVQEYPPPSAWKMAQYRIISRRPDTIDDRIRVTTCRHSQTIDR